MKTILWVSQHAPLPRHLARLRKLFGVDTQVIHDPRSFSSAEEIVERFKRQGADDMVVVAPLSVIDHIRRQGVHPLWAEMDELRSPVGADFAYRGRHYKFIRFRRIKELRLEFMEDFDDGSD